MSTILHVVGARPNFVKVAAVIDELSARLPLVRQVIAHTGQHYDRVLSDIFFQELGIPAPDYSLGVGSGPNGAQIARSLERLLPVLEREQPDVVLVAGDVNSTLAGALAAVSEGVPIAHVEAGLRSFDRSMPEEVNRVLVDQVSHWCFTHSPEAETNLVREGIDPERIHFVGNTMIDTLVRLRPRIDASNVHEKLGLEARGYILVTLHRPALVDGPLFERAMASLARLSSHLPVVFPLHPRARKRLGQGLAARASPRLKLLEPFGYIDFLALEAGAAAVVTDSGGVQEETTFLGVPCFTLRENTERPITLVQGTNRLLGLRPERIEELPRLLNGVSPTTVPAGWEGRAAERAVSVLAPALA